jgi:hypothetical protein
MEEKYRIHAAYILSILSSIIVMLITIKWAKIEGLATYLNFALTTSSLLLAILAIAYSFHQNSTSSRILNALEFSTKQLTHTSSELSTATKTLSLKVEIIPEAIRSVESKVQQTHALIETLEKGRINIPVGNVITTDISSEILDNFLSHSSINGLLVLYYFSLSNIHQRPVPTDKAMAELLEMAYDYALAYDVACRALGLYTIEPVNELHLCNQFNAHVAATVHASILSKFTEFEKAIPGFYSSSLVKLQKVEAYFAPATPN